MESIWIKYYDKLAGYEAILRLATAQKLNRSFKIAMSAESDWRLMMNPVSYPIFPVMNAFQSISTLHEQEKISMITKNPRYSFEVDLL